jgi:hypothetical protein
MTLEIAWVERDLRAVDRLTGDAAVGSIFDDERPPRGLAGLVDWRTGGRVSTLCLQSFVSGKAGEMFLTPGRPRLPFEKVLIVGLGPRAVFDASTYRLVLERALRALADLQVRRATIDLPGRHAGAIEPAAAFETLRALLAEGAFDFEALTLLDDGEAQRVYAAAVAQNVRLRR